MADQQTHVPTGLQETDGSADRFRKAYGGRVGVPLPKAGITLWCRRPDVADAVAHQLLPMPLLKSVLLDAEMAGMLGLLPEQQAAAAPDKATTFIEHMNPQTMEFIDRWTCLAADGPRVVMDRADQGPDALWIMDMPLEDKTAVFSATFNLAEMLRAGGSARQTFRPGADGAATGLGGAAVSVPAVDAAGDR